MPDGKGKVPAAASFGERDHPDDFLACSKVHIVHIPPELLIIHEFEACIVDNILQCGKSLRIKDFFLKFRIVGVPYGTLISRSYHAFSRSLCQSGGHEGETGVKAFRQGKARTGGSGCSRTLPRPCHIIEGFFEVAEQLLVDDIPVGLVEIYRLRCHRLETCRDLTESLEKLGVKDSTEGKGLAEEGSHFRTLLRVSVFTDSVDSQVDTLDTAVQLIVRSVVLIELGVGNPYVIHGNLRLVTPVARNEPFDVGIVAVPRKITSSVGVGAAEDVVHGIKLIFRQRRIGKEIHLVEIRRRFRGKVA